MARIVAAIAAALLVVGIVLLWRGSAIPAPAAPDGDEVTIVQAPAPATAPPPAPVATLGEPGERIGGVSEGLRASILTALRMPAGARLQEVTTNDAGKGVVCGTVSGEGAGPARRFVYVAMAGLAAIDDGGTDFARTRARLCAS